MTSALTHLAAGTELVEPVAARRAAGPGRTGRHRPDRRAHHDRQTASVPGPHLRRADRGHRRRARTSSDVLASFSTGFGSTAASVGDTDRLGAMFAKLSADSGGADEIVDTIVGHASPRALPWAMALVGAIIGLPMFFEIGLVLLMPVIYLVARRSQLSLITVGIPALAGLSAMHGFVPPHPGPVAAISLLNADLGVTLALGVLVAIPTIVVAGPLFGKLAGRWVVLEVPDRFDAADCTAGPTGADAGGGATTGTTGTTADEDATDLRHHHVQRPAAGGTR